MLKRRQLCGHIYDLAREICNRYEQIDGLFFDICFFIEPAIVMNAAAG